MPAVQELESTHNKRLRVFTDSEEAQLERELQRVEVQMQTSRNWCTFGRNELRQGKKKYPYVHVRSEWAQIPRSR